MIRNSKWLIVLILLLIPYTVFFSINQINQHKLSLNLVGFDLGQFNQCLYNTVRGRSPTTTIGIEGGEGPRSLHLFRKHLYPIFFILLPFYCIFPGYQVLLVIYVVFISASALLLYLISVKETGYPCGSFLLSLSYLLCPIIWRSFYWGFRPLPLAIAFIFLAYYFLKSNKNILYYTFLILSLFCKENVAVFTFFLGIFIFLDKNIPRRRVAGILTMLLSLGYLLITIGLLVPIFSEVGRYRSLEDIGSRLTISQVIDFIHLHRGRLIKIFAPLSFIPFISGGVILIIPGLLTYYLYNLTWNIWQNTLLVAMVYLSAVMGMRRIKERPVLLAVAMVIMIGGIIYFVVEFITDIKIYRLTPVDKMSIQLAEEYIPSDSSVLAQPMQVHRFSSRDEIYLLNFDRPRSVTDFEECNADYIFWGCRRAYTVQEFDEINSMINFLKET
ncbi:MAG: DUF2079 domain-containing protein, partial [Candidatus Auribacterota bacterium]|nr:DUF2079 domain-containing protein [Candidatus Auribacterota bacterium]